MQDFYTPLSPLNQTTRQNPQREIKELTEDMIILGLTDFCKTFHPNKKNIYFLVPIGTYSQNDNIVSNKENLKR